MIEREIDLISLLEKSLGEQPIEKLEEVGTVVKVGDGICKIYGLSNAVFGELITFERGSKGIILDMDEDYVSVVLIDNQYPVIEQDIARRSGSVLSVPVGEKLIGRVVSSMGQPLDALGKIDFEKMAPVEQVVPGIIDRSPINKSLETGITVIDTLFPIGRGQRELIIGNRTTGKTTLLLDTILHQKNQNVICIYVSIGHKQSDTAKIIHTLEANGALEYSLVVDADAKETALNQYLAPYVGCAIGEYFMNKGKDVLIIYDDLSKHAIAYRELSLLLRRPPGREAYPGDIFYIHSRLLERAGKLVTGGSLTALPVIQTQGDDISAYIPTNLISITDGQIFFDTNLFNSGIKPAVSIGLSVSRVGRAAQTKAIGKMAGALKLELAQYMELQAFSQFGSELDKASQRSIERGKRAIELLKQEERETYSFVDQVLFLFLLNENFLDTLETNHVKKFAVQFSQYFKGAYADVYNNILTTEMVSDSTTASLKKAAGEFSTIFTNE